MLRPALRRGLFIVPGNVGCWRWDEAGASTLSAGWVAALFESAFLAGIT